MESTANILKTIEERISQLPLQREPQGLYEPILYSMGNGGKRIRPLLTVLACQMFDTDKVDDAYTPAIAWEMFHNFTLLHDDLMDNAPIRRGKPTVPAKYGANTAILSGDTMLVEAFRILHQTKSANFSKIADLFTRTAQEVCEGQMYDMEFETRSDITENEYIEMIRLKTSVLIGACLMSGALMGGAQPADAQLMYDFGINLGLAFQLRDDLLDTFGKPETFGKRIGGDIVCSKKTYLLINALNAASAQDRATMNDWLGRTEFDEEQKIEAIKTMYLKYGIDKMSQKKIEEYDNEATQILDKLSAKGFDVSPLRELSQKLLNRDK